MANTIGAPANRLPTFGRSEQSGRPHIEVDPVGYHYIIAERGQELERRITFDLDDLLYLLDLDLHHPHPPAARAQRQPIPFLCKIFSASGDVPQI